MKNWQIPPPQKRIPSPPLQYEQTVLFRSQIPYLTVSIIRHFIRDRFPPMWSWTWKGHGKPNTKGFPTRNRPEMKMGMLFRPPFSSFIAFACTGFSESPMNKKSSRRDDLSVKGFLFRAPARGGVISLTRWGCNVISLNLLLKISICCGFS